MEILLYGILKILFNISHKDTSFTVFLLAVSFSHKHSALVHTVSATNTLQFSVSMCVIFCLSVSIPLY